MAVPRLIAGELVTQFDHDAAQRPTHLFVQAGVGGLAAALTDGIRLSMRAPKRVLVVEPQDAACVAKALVAARPVHITGDLRTIEGLPTTPSGATGLAGLLEVSSREELRERHQLNEDSCVLLVVTEGPLPST